MAGESEIARLQVGKKQALMELRHGLDRLQGINDNIKKKKKKISYITRYYGFLVTSTQYDDDEFITRMRPG
jgi:hypothetical protein